MPRGGYRKPANPAPVSGPGALSRRTDGGPAQGAKYIPGGKYGEGKQLMETQTAAPMAGSAPTPTPPAPELRQFTQLFAPTERPAEPVTQGMDFGPGANSSIIAGPTPTEGTLASTLKKLMQNDPTGEVARFYDYLRTRGM